MINRYRIWRTVAVGLGASAAFSYFIVNKNKKESSAQVLTPDNIISKEIFSSSQQHDFFRVPALKELDITERQIEVASDIWLKFLVGKIKSSRELRAEERLLKHALIGSIWKVQGQEVVPIWILKFRAAFREEVIKTLHAKQCLELQVDYDLRGMLRAVADKAGVPQNIRCCAHYPIRATMKFVNGNIVFGVDGEDYEIEVNKYDETKSFEENCWIGSTMKRNP